jgi:hypothetical protein
MKRQALIILSLLSTAFGVPLTAPDPPKAIGTSADAFLAMLSGAASLAPAYWSGKPDALNNAVSQLFEGAASFAPAVFSDFGKAAQAIYGSLYPTAPLGSAAPSKHDPQGIVVALFDE